MPSGSFHKECYAWIGCVSLLQYLSLSQNHTDHIIVEGKFSSECSALSCSLTFFSEFATLSHLPHTVAKIIGVVSLVNKITGFFTSNDESFVEAFGLFYGISLANISNYEEAKAAEARSQVALDIMTYHASSATSEADSLAGIDIPSALSLQLQSFSFTDEEMEDIDTIMVSHPGHPT